MEILTLLDRAELAGLVIRLDGDLLHIRGPREAAGLAQEIGQHKPQVLACWWTWQAHRLLRQVQDNDLRQDLQDLFDERFAVAVADSDDEPSAAMLAMGELIFDMTRRGIPVRVGHVEREGVER